jgi:hypothetical protein
MLNQLIEKISQLSPELQLKTLKLIASPEALTPEDLCSISPQDDLDLLCNIYDARLALSGYDPDLATPAEIAKFNNYSTTTLKQLEQKQLDINNNVSNEGILGFLNQTSTYLLDKAGEAINIAAKLVDPKNNQASSSFLNAIIDISTTSTFKAVVSGVMSGGNLYDRIQTIAQEAINRNAFGIAGVTAANVIASATDNIAPTDLKGPIRAAAKTIAKGGDILGAGFSAATNTLGAALPKYTREILTHAAIGAAVEYARTGNSTNIFTGAARGAIQRGIYQYIWEMQDGKIKLNEKKFIEAGISRIAGKLLSETATHIAPVTSAAAVAALVIKDNFTSFLQISNSPEIQQLLATIKELSPLLAYDLNTFRLSHTERAANKSKGRWDSLSH